MTGNSNSGKLLIFDWDLTLLNIHLHNLLMRSGFNDYGSGEANAVTKEYLDKFFNCEKDEDSPIKNPEQLRSVLQNAFNNKVEVAIASFTSYPKAVECVVENYLDLSKEQAKSIKVVVGAPKIGIRSKVGKNLHILYFLKAYKAKHGELPQKVMLVDDRKDNIDCVKEFKSTMEDLLKLDMNSILNIIDQEVAKTKITKEELELIQFTGVQVPKESRTKTNKKANDDYFGAVENWVNGKKKQVAFCKNGNEVHEFKRNDDKLKEYFRSLPPEKALEELENSLIQLGEPTRFTKREIGLRRNLIEEIRGKIEPASLELTAQEHGFVALLRDGCNSKDALSGDTMKKDFPRMSDELYINSKSLKSLDIIDQYYKTDDFDKRETREVLMDIWKNVFTSTVSVNSAIIDELITNCNQAGYSAILTRIFLLYFSNNQYFTTENRKVSIKVVSENSLKITCFKTIVVKKEKEKEEEELEELGRFDAEIDFILKSNGQDVEYKEVKFLIGEIPSKLSEYLTKNGLSLVDDLNEIKKGNLLHTFARKGNVRAVVELLLEGVIDIYQLDQNGKTALHHATDPEVVSTLMKAVLKRERKSYVNMKDENGNTALHYLATTTEKETKEYAKIVDMLLKNGANPYIKNKDLLDALDVAMNCNNYRFAEFIGSFEKQQKKNRQLRMVASTAVAGLTVGLLIAYFAGVITLTSGYAAAGAFIGAAVVGALVGAAIGYGVAKFCEKVSEEKDPDISAWTALKNVLTPEYLKEQSGPCLTSCTSFHNISELRKA